MREKILTQLADLHTSRPWTMLGISILVTLVLAVFAGQLTITMQMKDLLPSGDPKVDQFNEIIDEFATATSVIVVVQGEEDEIKRFADDLAPRLLELKDTSQNESNRMKIEAVKAQISRMREKGKHEDKIAPLKAEIEALEERIDFDLFQRVDYKAETEFLRNHALMLVKAEDLENTKDTFTSPNLVGLLTNVNNALEKEYVGQEESISTREKEDGAVGFLDGIESLTMRLTEAAGGDPPDQEAVQGAADKFLLGEPYFLSYDKTTLILNVIPNFTIMDRDLIMVSYDETKAAVDRLLADYPDVKAGLSGDIAREHDEQLYSQQSLNVTTLIAFAAILVLLVIAFRMWVAPIFAILTLIAGVIWANGLAFLFVGQLNMMTAMLSIVLLGLGIDFAIHMISGVTEWRAAGDSIRDAFRKTFLKSGKGIITGALTTACAFLALLVSRSRGMWEMGVVTGVGLIAIMLATFFVLPVLLVLRERHIDKKRERKGSGARLATRDITFRSLGKWAELLGKRYPVAILVSLAVSALLIWSALEIQYEQNWMKMEPKGLESIALSDTINHKFDLSMEYGLCLADGIEESRDLAEQFRDLSVVAMTNDITLYLPSAEEQADRVPIIREIRNVMRSAGIRQSVTTADLAVLKREIARLEMNVIEMQDMAFLGGQDKVDNKCAQLVGDPDRPGSASRFQPLIDAIDRDPVFAAGGLSEFQQRFAPYFKQNVLKMCSTDPIALEDLPVSVLDRYSNPDRTKFMITIYPAGALYTDATVLNRFAEDMESVTPKATGTPIVGVAWLKIAARDGRNAILLTLVIVFGLLWFDFRKPKYALIGMIPLALGVFWMVGLMQISGMLLSMMTMMGLPLIIGIGIDDGVHVMHRWQNEGHGKLRIVYSSTGRAILLTSLTTMLAFGSMIFSVFPAWAWFGQSLFIGVGACFLTTVIILPGLLGWIERKKK